LILLLVSKVLLLRRSDSLFRQRTINITRRYVSWHGAAHLNVHLWSRKRQLLAPIHARHVPAPRDLTSLKNGSCPQAHPSASSPGIIKRTVNITHRYGPLLGATISDVFLWARQRDPSFSHQHSQNQALCVLGWVVSSGRPNPPLNRTLQPRSTFSLMLLDFSSPPADQLAVAPVSFDR